MIKIQEYHLTAKKIVFPQLTMETNIKIKLIKEENYKISILYFIL